MLKRLRIQNHTLIQRSEIEFSNGLNILTGETGSGKSIIIDALGLLLGDRSDLRVLMDGEDKCIVEAEFDQLPDSVHLLLQENELDDAQTCIIRREITRSGKSRAFVNDTPVTLQVLKILGVQLVDVVSQHETMELQSAAFQLSLVDTLAGNEENVRLYRETRKQYLQIKNEWNRLREEENGLRQQEDYNRFILHELLEANPISDEEKELENRIQVLSHAESIREMTAAAAAALEEQEDAIHDRLRSLIQSLQGVSRHHDGVKVIVSRLESLLSESRDIAAELQDITERTEADPETLAQAELRLQTLVALHKKHRVNDNNGLLRIIQELELALSHSDSLSQRIQQLETEIVQLHTQLKSYAYTLHESRKSILPSIEKQVIHALEEVAMPQCLFEIRLQEPQDVFGPDGVAGVEFYFSANAGKSPQLLSKIASGGEMSRMMLCLKSLLNDSVNLPTIVFDEIDTGISGNAALQVGFKIQSHAKAHQVIAITHLPQIAARADRHFKVSKQIQQGKTVSEIETLSNDAITEQIASMLSGSNPGEHALNAARELLQHK